MSATTLVSKFISNGQTSIVDNDREYIGWTCIEYNGNGKVTFLAVDNIKSYANPNITYLYDYQFSKKWTVGFPPLELFMIYFNSGFYTHCSGSNHAKQTVFTKACEKYCNKLEKTFTCEHSI